jgi:hypothetical protein
MLFESMLLFFFSGFRVLILWFFPPPASALFFFCFSPLCYSSSTRSLFPVFFLLPVLPVSLPASSFLSPVLGPWFFVSFSLGFCLWFSYDFFPVPVAVFFLCSSPPFCLCSALPFIEPESLPLKPVPVTVLHLQDC